MLNNKEWERTLLGLHPSTRCQLWGTPLYQVLNGTKSVIALVDIVIYNRFFWGVLGIKRPTWSCHSCTNLLAKGHCYCSLWALGQRNGGNEGPNVQCRLQHVGLLLSDELVWNTRSASSSTSKAWKWQDLGFSGAARHLLGYCALYALGLQRIEQHAAQCIVQYLLV